jgi:plastocyanin
MKRALVLATLFALFGAATALPAEAPTRAVTMPGKLYEPSTLDVLVGTTVTWRNDDSTNHTVTADEDAFSSGYVPPGGSFTFTFTKQGHYAFHCTIHKLMKGEVDVFGLVLAGPEAPVTTGRRIVLAGLAPAGAETVTVRGSGSEHTVRARADGSFALRVAVATPGSYRARSGALVSPPVMVAVRPIIPVVRTGRTLVARSVPARPGATALLQTYDRERFAWRSVADGKLDGRARIRFALPAGPDRVRVVVVGTQGWADGVSRTMLLGAGT